MNDDTLENSERYTFLRWNSEYGFSAKFVVLDNNTGKQSIFTPGRAEDVVWITLDLTQCSDIAKWEDFCNESVKDLEEVVF